MPDCPLSCSCPHARRGVVLGRTSERNTDENKVGPYTLPEILLTKDGRRVTDAAL